MNLGCNCEVETTKVFSQFDTVHNGTRFIPNCTSSSGHEHDFHKRICFEFIHHGGALRCGKGAIYPNKFDSLGFKERLNQI
jgi:hypothetical protein